MKFDHLVKHNGIYYTAGTDVPIENESLKGASAISKVEDKKVEPTVVKVEPVIEETVVVEDANTKKKYTKTDINRMSTKELRELAKTVGINGDEFVGSELKEMLIKKLV